MMREMMKPTSRLPDHDPMRDHRAIEQEPLELVLAPAAVEGGGVQGGEVGGIARRRFGHARLRTREQLGEETHHRRGSLPASCGCASGARR